MSPHVSPSHAYQRNPEATRCTGEAIRVVAKFGGVSFGSGDRIDRAADSIVAAVEYDHKIAAVTSAMGSMTDSLLSEIKFEAGDRDRAEIVLMGEWTSMRILKAALATRGINILFVGSGIDEWPVIANDLGEVDVEVTRRWATKLAAELGGVAPVITGFLAQSHDGEITILGRGGSDTSAVILDNYMDADEVVIVIDAEDVMTGDPCVVGGMCNVGRITIDELRDLLFRGAEVIASSALLYKGTALDVRAAHYQHNDLLTGGVLIEGEFHNLIDMQEKPLACFAVVGRAICS